MPCPEDTRVAKKKEYLDFLTKKLEETEAEIAKIETNNIAEWEPKADWLFRLIKSGGLGYPVDVRAEKQRLERNEAFMSYFRLYCTRVHAQRYYDKTVEDLKTHHEVANCLGKHHLWKSPQFRRCL